MCCVSCFEINESYNSARFLGRQADSVVRARLHDIDHGFRQGMRYNDHYWRNRLRGYDHQFRRIASGIDGAVREIMTGGKYSRNHGTRMWSLNHSDLAKVLNTHNLQILIELVSVVGAGIAFFGGVGLAGEMVLVGELTGLEIGFAEIVGFIGSFSVAAVFELLGPAAAIMAAAAIIIAGTIELMELTGAISMPSGGMFGPGV